MKIKHLFIILAILIVTSFPSNSLSQQVKRQRIISLAPSTTEILFRLGLDDEIVGVTNTCNYPSRVRDKEKVGTFSQPNIEKILSLKPDIIFATGLEQAMTVQRLRQLRLKVYVSDPSNIQELFTSIREIGELTHREREALDLINQMRIKIDQFSAKVKLIPQDKKPKVFIEIWHEPLMTAGSGSFIDELIRLAGGINITHDAPRVYSHFSPEQVIKRNPDYIFLGHRSKGILNIIKKQLGWKEIKAVKNNCIYNDINPDLFLRPGPRLVEGLEEIHRRIYPGR
jgi:iron complex transport system substrate-binding protein